MTRAERRIIAARIRRKLHKIFAEYEDYPLYQRQRFYRRIRCNEGRNWPNGLRSRDLRLFDRYYFAEGRQAKHRREMARLNEELRLWQRGEFDDMVL